MTDPHELTDRVAARGVTAGRWVPPMIAVLAASSVLLAVLGLIRTPTAFTDGQGPLAVAGVVVAQVACLVATLWGPLSVRVVAPAALVVGVPVGAVVGALYGTELLTENISAALTRHSVTVGYLILGALVAASLVTGCLGALGGRGFGAGVSAALWNAIAGYLVWYPFVLIGYH